MLKLIHSLILSVEHNKMSKSEAFDCITRKFKDQEPHLPSIPKDAKERDDIHKFIELAQRISIKYRTILDD
jgi:hypothetical protein